MTWETALARLNASVVGEARGFGEPCTLYLHGLTDGIAVSVALARIPQPIGETGSWEELPTASVRVSDCPRTPGQGDIIVEASGHRWIVDRQEERDGMHVMTLRADPSA